MKSDDLQWPASLASPAGGCGHFPRKGKSYVVAAIKQYTIKQNKMVWPGNITKHQPKNGQEKGSVAIIPQNLEKTLNFYKKRGFIEYTRIRDFFIQNYPHPIIENGVQLKDMIYLKKDLQRDKT